MIRISVMAESGCASARSILSQLSPVVSKMLLEIQTDTDRSAGENASAAPQKALPAVAADVVVEPGVLATTAHCRLASHRGVAHPGR